MTAGLTPENIWLKKWIEGPQRLRWTELPLQPGDKAPSVRLLTPLGQSFELSEAWSSGPAVLIFLRHFGCGCAWERAQRLASELSRLNEAGAEILCIGQGDPQRTWRFREQAGITCPVLSDEGGRAYQAFGLLDARPSQVVYGMPEALLRRDPNAGAELLKARQGSSRVPVDSPWQLPGEFVIDRDGLIKLAYRSQYCADYADPDVLVAAIHEAKLGL